MHSSKQPQRKHHPFRTKSIYRIHAAGGDAPARRARGRVERINEYLLVDLKHNRLTLFGKPNDLGYGGSRELCYGGTFWLAAMPDVVFTADPFLDARSSPWRRPPPGARETRPVMLEVKRPS